MPVTQKLGCVVEQVVPHGERAYTLALRPDRPVPRFRAGQFLHLALDPYDPSDFWPDSRAFSIASSPTDRDRLLLTYAVHGRFTSRMEQHLAEGRHVWVKLPYGDFIVDGRSEVVLFAGGTGITAFAAFLEGLPGGVHQPVTLAYGARTEGLLIYRDLAERCAERLPSFQVAYFVEDESGSPMTRSRGSHAGRVSVGAIWERVRNPFEATFYISGPPPMLRTIGADLRARDIAPEAIRIDAWE